MIPDRLGLQYCTICPVGFSDRVFFLFLRCDDVAESKCLFLDNFSLKNRIKVVFFNLFGEVSFDFSCLNCSYLLTLWQKELR